MVKVGELFEKLKHNNRYRIISPFNKLAAIKIDLVEPWLVSISLFEYLPLNPNIIGRMQDSSVEVECRNIATNGSQTTGVYGDPRLIVRLTDCICHFEYDSFL